MCISLDLHNFLWFIAVAGLVSYHDFNLSGTLVSLDQPTFASSIRMFGHWSRLTVSRMAYQDSMKEIWSLQYALLPRWWMTGACFQTKRENIQWRLITRQFWDEMSFEEIVVVIHWERFADNPFQCSWKSRNPQCFSQNIRDFWEVPLCNGFESKLVSIIGAPQRCCTTFGRVGVGVENFRNPHSKSENFSDALEPPQVQCLTTCKYAACGLCTYRYF